MKRLLSPFWILVLVLGSTVACSDDDGGGGGTDVTVDRGGGDFGGQDSGGQDSGGQDSGGQDSGGQDSGGQDSGGEDSSGDGSIGDDTGGDDTGGLDAIGDDIGGVDAIGDDAGGGDDAGTSDLGEDVASDLGSDVSFDFGADVGFDFGADVGFDFGFDIGFDIGADAPVCDDEGFPLAYFGTPGTCSDNEIVDGCLLGTPFDFDCDDLDNGSDYSCYEVSTATGVDLAMCGGAPGDSCFLNLGAGEGDAEFFDLLDGVDDEFFFYIAACGGTESGCVWDGEVGGSCVENLGGRCTVETIPDECVGDILLEDCTVLTGQPLGVDCAAVFGTGCATDDIGAHCPDLADGEDCTADSDGTGDAADAHYRCAAGLVCVGEGIDGDTGLSTFGTCQE